MTNDLDIVLKYRKRMNEASRKAAMAEGALEQAMERLSKGYSCSTRKIGRKLLRDLEKKRDRAKRDALRKLDEFSEKWKEQLG